MGGLGLAVTTLCSALARRGVDVRLLMVDPVNADAPPGVEMFTYPRSRWFQTLGLSTSFKSALRDAAQKGAGIIHSHSLWRASSIYPAEAKQGTKCRFVFSPHGTLSPWMMNFRKWRKQVVWTLMQHAALKEVDCFQVTSEKELAEVRRFFRTPSAIIPNGIDMPTMRPVEKSESVLRRLLFLGRMHEVKGVDRLLKSWFLLQRRYPEWELVAAGEDEGGYLSRMRRLAEELKLERVSFPGKINALERDSLYQSADLFVLPSHTENFGIAVAEALANGVPVVVTQFAPWKNLEREGCGWWTDTQPDVLAECLAYAMVRPREKLAAMGALGREWMMREFSWDRVAEMTEQTYRWLLGGGAHPEWVS